RGSAVTSHWSFVLDGISEPIVLLASTPKGWVVDSVSVGGREITDSPILVAPGQRLSGVTVALTQRLTELSGSVKDGSGPASDVSVLVCPEDDALWTPYSRYIRLLQLDQAGKYVVRGLPAYEGYRAAVVQGLTEGQATDPSI